MTLKLASFFYFSLDKELIGILVWPLFTGGKPNEWRDLTQLYNKWNEIIIIWYLHIGKSLVAPAIDAMDLVLIRLLIWIFWFLGIFVFVFDTLVRVRIIAVILQLWVLILFIVIIVKAVITYLFNTKIQLSLKTLFLRYFYLPHMLSGIDRSRTLVTLRTGSSICSCRNFFRLCSCYKSS